MLASFIAMLLGADLPRELNPDKDNFRVWKAFIEPSAQEASYRKISWRTEFWPAVVEAKKLERPILLWTMNGHPMGCT